MKRELRPYQTRAIEMLRQSLGSGKLRPVLQAPTGFGKTRLAAAVVEGALAKKKRVIFTVPALSLVDQTVRAFWDDGIRDVGVIQGMNPMTDWSRPVQVASVQTLQRRPPIQGLLAGFREISVRPRVRGGGRSDRRTCLSNKFPGNREINREFREIPPSLRYMRPSQRAKSIACRQIPCAMEQGKFKWTSGKIKWTSGKICRRTEKFILPITDRLSNSRRTPSS
jgi:hypothetical protein